MNKIKAIILDVDGTLVSFETHRVPQSAVDALKQAHEKGMKIVIATGRAASDLHEIDAIPYDAIIALNGADCRLRSGATIRKRSIAKEDFHKAMQMAKEYDFAVGIELDGGVFVNRLTPTVEHIARIVEHPIPPVVDLEEMFGKGECCQLCHRYGREGGDMQDTQTFQYNISECSVTINNHYKSRFMLLKIPIKQQGRKSDFGMVRKINIFRKRFKEEKLDL